MDVRVILVPIDNKIADVLAANLSGFERLETIDRLTGGASQETYRIETIVQGERQRFALRLAAGRDKAGDTGHGIGLELEAKLIRTTRAAGVPGPEVICVLEEANGLGSGFLMEWLDGETLGSRINKAPELDDVRPKLAYECGEILARIHAVDVEMTGLSADLETVTTKAFIQTHCEAYHEFGAPAPMIDYTARWLMDNIPPDSRVALTHNDFRNGNLIVAPDGIAAVLDWELAHIGDPIRDIGWLCTNSWRFGLSENEVGGFGKLDDLLAGYEAQSGIAVSREHVRFWQVFGSFWWAIGCLKMATRWKEGPDRSVEQPVIGRRSSECQVDCANLIIPGPVELIEPEPANEVTALPSSVDLLQSVHNFLNGELASALVGRNKFLARVAANSLTIVMRERQLAQPHLDNEHARLKALLGKDGPLDELRWALVHSLRDGSIAQENPDLKDHLRATIVNQLAIEQPKYSGLKTALAG